MTRHSFRPMLSVLILPFLALTAPAQQVTGTSHPDQLPDSTLQTDHYVKPSHEAPAPAPYQDSYPATAAEPKLITREPSAAAPVLVPAPPAPASSQYVPYTPAPVETADAIPVRGGDDPNDGRIVLDVPMRPHELNRGTLLHARLRETLNTQTTPEGSVFTAELLADVGHHGEVMLPAGSLIRGHVTSIHGGKRLTGGASMHLRPETVSLPDGTPYHLDAQVTDLASTQDLRVNYE